MASPPVWVAIVRAVLAEGGPPQLMIDTALKELIKAGVAVKLDMTPDQLLPHPKNRGGRMVVATDVENKGALMVQQGCKLSLVGLSVAFELPAPGSLKDTYMGDIQKLVDGSEGRLAPISGSELGMTVASTHTAAFCRCSIFGTKTDNPKLANFDGCVQAPESFKGDFADMCRKGWPWILIRREVEIWIPELPAKFSLLNGQHAIGGRVGEIECVRSLANMLENGSDKEEAMKLLLMASPVCQDYIGDLASYAMLYSGGAGSPLLCLLDDYTKTLKLSQCQVGSEFINAVVSFKSSVTTSTLPFCRLACWLAQSTSPRVIDGICRLLYGRNFKLFASKPADEVEALELLLAQGFELAKRPDQDHSTATMAYGKMATRAMLHFLNQEKASREPKGFKSLKDINDLFLFDLGLGPMPEGCKAKSQKETASTNASCKLHSMSDTHDAEKIAIAKQPSLKIGGNFLTKLAPGKVVKLEKIEADKAIVSRKPLFKDDERFEIPIDQLKTLKAFASAAPKLHELPVSHLFENMQQIKDELEKANVFRAMMEIYAEKSCNEDLTPATDPTGLYVSEGSDGYKKGELVLGMTNTYTSIRRLTSKDDISKISALQLIKTGGKPVFQIAMPANKAMMTTQSTAVFVPAAWVAFGGDKVTMEVKHFTKNGFEFPFLVNTVQLKAKSQITRFRVQPTPKPEAQPLKRQRTADAI